MKSNIVLRYSVYGILFGLLFPLGANLLLLYQRQLLLTIQNIALIHQQDPLLFIIDTAPLFLGGFAYLAGLRQAGLTRLMENINFVMLENMPDGALILDEQNRILDINDRAQAAIGMSKAQVERWPVSSVIPGWPKGRDLSRPSHWETSIGEQRQARIYEVQISAMQDWRGAGHSLVVLKDITENKRHSRELATLLEASQAVSSTLDLETTLGLIAEQLARAFDASKCTISRWNKDVDAVVTWIQEWTRDATQADQAGTIYYLNDFPATRSVLTTRKPLIIRVSDPGADKREVDYLLSTGTQSSLLLPLAIGDNVFGLIELEYETYERDFSEGELRLARAMADQMAIAVENARLYTESLANLEAAQTLHRQYIEQSWTKRLAESDLLEYTYQRSPHSPAPSETQGDSETTRRIRVPIQIREQAIGSLTIEADPHHDVTSQGEAWTPEEMAIIHAVANQAAQALENARLLEDTQRRAERERIAANIAAKVWASSDAGGILQTVLRELGSSLPISEGLIQIDLQPGGQQEIFYE
jgi:PAS domain S-box-containing protein